MGPKMALNRLYLEKYKELEAETSANENGILVNILWKFGKKKIFYTRRNRDRHFSKTEGDPSIHPSIQRPSDGRNDVFFRQKNVTKILSLIDCAPPTVNQFRNFSDMKLANFFKWPKNHPNLLKWVQTHVFLCFLFFFHHFGSFGVVFERFEIRRYFTVWA